MAERGWEANGAGHQASSEGEENVQERERSDTVSVPHAAALLTLKWLVVNFMM